MLPATTPSTRRDAILRFVRAALVVLPLLVAPLRSHAQSPAWVTESGVAFRVGDRWNDGPEEIISLTFGRVAPVSRGISLGAVIQGGISEDAYFAVGPRVRFHTSPDISIALTPLVRITDEEVDPGQAWLETTLMYRDLVGLGLTLHLVDQQVSLDQHPWSTVREAQPVVTAGIRLGSRPGRVGAAVMGLAVVVAGFAFAASGW